jgi:hypothetical protein
MRVLFVENKHMTRTWDALAPRLQARGHEVHWLIQNRQYAARTGELHVMPFPKAAEGLDDPRLETIASQDRGVQYFGGQAHHYPHYMRQIEAVLDRVRPDVVIGEPTLFHERLTIEACESRALPYYFPCTMRYPSDRFGFHRGATQRLEHGSGETPNDSRVRELLDLYRARKNPPLFYSQPRGRIASYAQRLLKDLEAAWGWFRGERFNTPAPWTKLRLERDKRRRLARWNEIASVSRTRGRFEILFPLQMLPESNLELYASDFADQLGVLRKILAVTPPDTTVAVKANPVPRYEITDAWLSFAAAEPRIRLAPLAARMDDLFWTSDLIVTATGSVAIEAFMTRRPFVTFVEGPVTPFAPHSVVLPEDVGLVVEAIDQGRWDTPDAAVEMLRRQFALSHRGIVADTYNFPEVSAPENLDDLARAFDALAVLLAARPDVLEPRRENV